MIRNVFLVAVSIVFLTARPTAAEEPLETLSLDNLLSIGSVVSGRDAPQWSPDGSRIAFMSGLRGGLNLMSVSPDGGFPELLAEDLGLVGTGSPSSQKPSWSPDGQWMAYVSSKGGAPEIWLWSVVDGRDVQLTNLGGRVNALKWSPSSDRIVLTNDRYGSQDVYTVSVPEGSLTRLTSDPRYEVYPTWTPDGRHILYVRMDERWIDHDVLEIPADGGEPRLVVEDRDFFDYRAGLSFGTPLPSPDGQTVMFRSLRNGWHNFWTVPRRGGQPRAIAPAHAEQSHARWSPDGSQIAFISNSQGTHELRVVPSAGGEPRVLVAPSDLGESMGVAAKPEWSPDGQRLSFTFSTPTQPEDLFVVRVATGEITRLTRSMPVGLAGRLAAPKKLTYPSTDGHTIQAYLYSPAGEGRHPAIVWVHGGPTSQFDDGFSRHRQVHYFVQRGYYVLMPNVRGSSGYGKAFEDANNRCWGQCDLEDVRAGVDFLKTVEGVDRDNLGITGTSYGGMLSMAAIAFAPNLFQAAIPISGYGDYSDFHTTVPELQHIQLAAYELGPYPENEALYRKLSPIFYLAQATTPALILHGEGQDVPWRPGQRDPEMASLDFARELDKHYKIFRYKSYPGESYYVYGRSNTREKLQDMLAFFDQYLKDDLTKAKPTTTND